MDRVDSFSFWSFSPVVDLINYSSSLMYKEIYLSWKAFEICNTWSNIIASTPYSSCRLTNSTTLFPANSIRNCISLNLHPQVANSKPLFLMAVISCGVLIKGDDSQTIPANWFAFANLMASLIELHLEGLLHCSCTPWVCIVIWISRMG